MREMYIEEITKNLNLLSEHFLKCVWIFTSNLASDKMKEQLITEIQNIQDEKFLHFILNTILSFKQKWGIC